jgi:hypothetical protein
MRALFSSLMLAMVATVGCSVPYEVDPNFGADSSLAGETSTSDADGAVDSEMPGDGGCKDNLDCAGRLDTPLCNVTSGQCVACLTSDRCVKGQYCDTKVGECKAGCRDDSDCTTVKPDAGVDAKSDTGDAGDAFVNILKCDPDTHMCRGCKVDGDCPLGFLCSATEAICKPGCNAAHGCDTGRECCDAQCADPTSDAKHCGGCGKLCVAPAHTVMKCEASTCKVASCEMGWGDCGAGDGCETDTNTDVNNCGGCGTVCTFTNGAGICEGGKCKVTSCTTGFGDCDKNGSNGCEQPLNTNTHCAACDTKCAPANGTGSCSSGTCAVTSCNTGFGDCDMTPGNGCETNLLTNATNCNTCGNVCPSTGGTPACVMGVCKFSTCVSGFGDCDGSGTCSTPITNDVNNCGTCGRTCSVANGTPKCTGSTCSIDSCTAGFADCNTSYIDGCERSLRTVTDCGGCGIPCSLSNATATCSTGTCAVNTCTAGFGNCDGIDSNGCETPTTNDVSHCGSCTKVCTVTNGTGSCTGTTCGVASCDAGYANCDADVTACEVNNKDAPSGNSCTAPTTIGGAAIIGCRTASTNTVTTTSTKYYKITLSSACGGAGCKASDPLRVRVALTNPTGVVYSLKLYKTSANCTAGTSSVGTSSTVGSTTTVEYSDTACPATQDLYIEVKWVSGSSCSNASLAVTGAF